MLNAGGALRNLWINDSATSAIVSTRIYPNTAPQSAQLPFGVYRTVDRTRERHMNGASKLARTRIQVDWFDRDRDQLETLLNAARVAVDVFTGNVIAGSDHLDVKDVSFQDQFDDYEPVDDGKGAPIFRVSQDYYVWHGEAIPVR